MMRTIAVEEHFASPGFISGAGREYKEQLLKSGIRGARVFEQLCDVGERRIAEMDAAGIDMQVLSLNYPGTEQLEAPAAVSVVREANDFLLEAVKNNPVRFAGLAALPTAVPDRAAKELERRVRQQAFKGAMSNHNRPDLSALTLGQHPCESPSRSEMDWSNDDPIPPSRRTP